jgi:HEAT repeat protein
MKLTNRILLCACAASLGGLLWLVGTHEDVAGPTARTVDLASSDAPSPSSIVATTEFPVMYATTPAEVRAVRRYCRSAEHDDVDTLRHAATQSSDPLVAGNAMRALGRLGAFAGDAELEAMLADERQRVRQEAVIALGQSGSPSAVERLLPLLEEDDPMLRPLVLQALGRLGGDKARAVLERVLADESATAADRALARAGLDRG